MNVSVYPATAIKTNRFLASPGADPPGTRRLQGFACPSLTSPSLWHELLKSHYSAALHSIYIRALISQKSSTVSKETYYSVKRDLLQCQKTYLLCMYVIKHRINTFIHSNIPMQITCSTSTHLYLCALQYNVCYKLLHKYTHMLTHKGTSSSSPCPSP